jgi:ferredoxin
MSDVPQQKLGDITVSIRRDGCISTGACVKAAPEVFRLDSRQLVTFPEQPAVIDSDRLIDACQFCPVGALSAVGADGERLAP